MDRQFYKNYIFWDIGSNIGQYAIYSPNTQKIEYLCI